jgi:hypothetical protein
VVQADFQKMKKISLIIILIISFLFTRAQSTNSYFRSVGSPGQNIFSIIDIPSSTPEETPTPTPTGTPEVTPTPTPSITPTPTPDLYQSVVINEIMWMGSLNSTADEWIELRNMTDREIEIGQWKIENVTGSGNDLNIPANKKIPANGFFLIANYPSTAANSDLNVDPDEVNSNLEFHNSSNGNIVLKTKDGAVIDRAKGTPWAGGQTSSVSKKSMERNDIPGDGLSALNWHTCIDAACNDTVFWDFEGGNYGTPKAANLSNEFGLELFMEQGNRTLGFKIRGLTLPEFETLDYLITYDSDSTKQGITGKISVDGKEEIFAKNLIMGTCSDKSCSYNTGVKNILLKIILTKGETSKELTASLE